MAIGEDARVVCVDNVEITKNELQPPTTRPREMLEV